MCFKRLLIFASSFIIVYSSYSLFHAYFPKMKRPVVMGMKITNMIDHWRMVLVLLATVAAAILSFACRNRKAMMVGARSIQTIPRYFFNAFIVV